MATGVKSWSKTAATNANADSSINWAEGQAPSSVNDSARAVMARVAEYRDDNAGSLVTGGSSTAYTLTTNSVFASLAEMSGQAIRVRFHVANGAAPTLAVDGLAAKAIQIASGTAVGTSVIATASVWDLTYDNAIPAFLLNSVTTQIPDGAVATAGLADAAVTYRKVQNVTNGRLLGNFTGSNAPPGEYALGAGLVTASSSSTVTITIAAPGVVTWSSHGLAAGQAITLATSGALPTGLATGTPYYVLSPATNTFTLSANPAGSAITTTGSQSGTHTATAVTTIKAPAFPVPGGFKNLSIKVATNTTVTVAADFVTTTDGTNFQTTALSGTCDLGTNGAVNALDAGSIAVNKVYHIWAIAKVDGTTGTLASLSSSAPTLPTGYTYKARIGSVRTINGSATLYGTWQFGRKVQYVVGLAQTTTAVRVANGVVGDVTVPTYVAVTIQGDSGANLYVPSTASRVFLSLGADANAVSIVAPNASYGSYISATNPPFVVGGIAVTATVTSAIDFMLEAATIQWASNTAAGALYVRGWEENI